jgi:hypothetical protein
MNWKRDQIEAALDDLALESVTVLRDIITGAAPTDPMLRGQAISMVLGRYVYPNHAMPPPAEAKDEAEKE